MGRRRQAAGGGGGERDHRRSESRAAASEALRRLSGGDARPAAVIFYTNGYKTYLWDDFAYPPRPVAGFYKKDELASLIIRRVQRAPLDVSQVRNAIVERYYQKRAIGSIADQFAQARRKALLVMATGSGKTRTAIALVDLLLRAGWVKRALFLADRVSLVKQAVGAFKAHLPQSSPVNLVTEKNTKGRVYVCTYPTMMGADQRDHGQRGALQCRAFRSRDHRRSASLGVPEVRGDLPLLRLAAGRSDRDTTGAGRQKHLRTLRLVPGVPTDAYELETAVADGFLVPPRVRQVDLKFPREGIDYDSLSDEEQEQWESLDWGDDVGESSLRTRSTPPPSTVGSSTRTRWTRCSST